jgi:type VI secretion system protein ImpH
MPTENRRLAACIIECLATSPHQFQLTQAVRLLIRWLNRYGVSQEQIWSQVLRFQNSLSLDFPASEVESIHISGVSRWVDAPAVLQRGGSVRIHVTPRLLGALGICGTLPLSYTERVATRLRLDKNSAARAFIDLFSHRMVALYCQAWDKHRLEHLVGTAGDDKQLDLLLSLAGVRREALRDGAIPPAVCALYAGLLRARPASASALANVAADYFNVPVRMQQFVGGWDAIPKHMRSTLGTVTPRLAYGAALGIRMWRQDRRARLIVGPVDRDSLMQFLPAGAAAIALAKMLTLFAAPSLIYELQVLLKLDCVTPLVLGQHRRLGWDTFLIVSDSPVATKSIGYLLRTG